MFRADHARVVAGTVILERPFLRSHEEGPDRIMGHDASVAAEIRPGKGQQHAAIRRSTVGVVRGAAPPPERVVDFRGRKTRRSDAWG